MKRILTTIIILFSSISFGYGQCSVNLGKDFTSCGTYTLYAGHMDTVDYLWPPSGDTTQSLTVTKTGTYIVKITTKSNCVARDTVKVTINPLPDLTTKALKPYCYNFGKVNLLADANPTTPGIIFSSKIPGLVVQVGATWWFNTPILDGTKAHRIKIYKEYTHPSTSCYNKDSFYIEILDNPIVKVKDQTFCQDVGDIELSGKKEDIVVLPTQGNINGGFRTWTALSKDGGTAPPVLRNDGTSFNAKWVFVSIYPNTARLGKYKLEFKFENSTTGCSSLDTMCLEIKEVPVISFTPIPEQCNHWDTLNLDNYVNLKKGEWKVIEKNSQREWDPGMYSTYVIDDYKFDPSIVDTSPFTTFYLKYEHATSGCPTSDSIQMIVNGRPNLETNLQLDSQCNTFNKLTLRAKVNGTSNPNIIWEGEYVYRNILNLDSIPFNSSESVKNYTIKYSYQDPYTTCESFDSTIVSVQAQASLNIMLDTLRSVYDSIIPLRAEGVFVNEILWSTAGDGNFTSNNKLLTQYKQGTYDKKIGGSILYLESRNNGACRVVKDSLILEIFPLSLKQNEFNSIKIYPSPTAANFSIELPHDFTLGTLRIVGLDGKLVKEFMVNKDNRIFTEDISSIPTGIYFIELVSKEGIYNGKIMKR